MSTVLVESALAAPVNVRALALLELRESQWFERKSRRVKAADLVNVLVGFANAEGGTVVVGLSRGLVEGVDGASTQVSEWQQAAIDFSSPPVRTDSRLVECLTPDGNNHVLLIQVEASDQVHTTHRDEVYLRVGDETRKLSFSQRQELLYDKGQSHFEGTFVRGSEQQDLDVNLLQSYADAVRHPDPARLLLARGLLGRGGEPTVGAVLLFASTPQVWFPESTVRVLRYRGRDRGSGARQQLLADRHVDGPIPHQFAAAREMIRELLPSRRALVRSGRFENVGLIPEDAWLEGLVNAVVHRSYSISGDHIRVEIFDDRIEIESPGRFPGLADPFDPLHVTRFARNPRIARVCSDLDFGQELGEGIRRMFEEMQLAGLSDPSYRQTSGSTRLTLLSTPVDRALEERLPARSRELVRLIREAGRASTGELVAASRQSRPVVIRQLRALREAGVVAWTGHGPHDPRAYWSLRVG